MTNRKHRLRMCVDAVRNVLIRSHRKCNIRKRSHFEFSGRKINCFFGVDGLDEDHSYKVCSNVADMLKQYRQPRRKSAVQGTPRQSNRISGIVDSNRCMNGNDDVNCRHPRTSHDETFLHSVLDQCKSFHIPYVSLSMRERSRRVELLAATIIASCVTKKDLQVKGSDYLHGNKELGVDILTVVDAMKERVQNGIKVNLSSIGHMVTPPPAGVEESNEQEEHNKFGSAIHCGTKLRSPSMLICYYGNADFFK